MALEASVGAAAVDDDTVAGLDCAVPSIGDRVDSATVLDAGGSVSDDRLIISSSGPGVQDSLRAGAVIISVPKSLVLTLYENESGLEPAGGWKSCSARG
jgi:hypothetical protein